MCQCAVSFPRGYVKIYVPGRGTVSVSGYVSVPAVYEPFNKADHISDVAGCARLISGRKDPQGIVGICELILVVVRARPPVLAFCGRSVQDLVVDIGNIAYKYDFVSKLHQPAADNVKSHTGPEMPDMRGALHCCPAHVHSDLPGDDRCKINGPVADSVIDADMLRCLREYGVRVDSQTIGCTGHKLRDPLLFVCVPCLHLFRVPASCCSRCGCIPVCSYSTSWRQPG